MKNDAISFITASSLSPRQFDTSPLGAIKLAKGFSELLTLTRKLGLRSLQCHWKAMEPGSTQLHSLFEQHYQSLRKAIDALADRVRALGFEPDEMGSPARPLEDVEPQKLDDTVGILLKGHKECALKAKALLSIADDIGDDLSANLAASRYMMHEKAAWVLLSLADATTPTRSLV